MVEFQKLLEQLELTTIWVITDAPLYRAFTPESWKKYRPSSRHFKIAVELGLLEEIGYDVYKLTSQGAAFKHYIDSIVPDHSLNQEVRYG